MPGIVGLFGFIFAVLIGLFVSGAIYFLLRRFRKNDRFSGVFAILLGIGVPIVLLWLSFGAHEYPVTSEEAEKRLPEFGRYGGSLVAGREFIDGLSDGEYYAFNMPPSTMTRFRKAHFTTRDRMSFEDWEMRSSSNHQPQWWPNALCKNGEIFDRRYTSGDNYLDRFQLYACPESQRVYAAWVRI